MRHENGHTPRQTGSFVCANCMDMRIGDRLQDAINLGNDRRINVLFNNYTVYGAIDVPPTDTFNSTFKL